MEKSFYLRMLSHYDKHSIIIVMDFMLFSFEQLDMWQFSMDFVTDIYKLLNRFPERERFSLTSQIRRAAISVPSNISEGSSRFSEKEKIHFNEIALGSLAEVICQLDIALRVGYISQEEFNQFKSKASTIGKMISGYRRSMINKMLEKKENNKLSNE